jgi:hypothetical protein
MRNALKCHKCETLLVLIREGLPNYSWRCPNHCLPPVDTGVSVSEIFDFVEGAESGNVEFNASLFWPPLSPNRVRTAKVFMPHILYHFIECTRGGCYNALYSNVIAPYLDSADVLDYVLRSSVVYPTSDIALGKTGARIYVELLQRLNGVQSEKIHQYISENFTNRPAGTTGN